MRASAIPDRSHARFTGPHRSRATSTSPAGATVSVAGAARILGVHVNTVRAWTDQGRLACLRINERGDRRYAVDDLHRFLARAERPAGGDAVHAPGLLGRVARLAARHDSPSDRATAVLRLLCRELGYEVALVVSPTGEVTPVVGTGTPDSHLVRRARRSSAPAYATRQSRGRAVALPFDDQGSVAVLSRPGPAPVPGTAERALLAALSTQLCVAAAAHRWRHESEDEARRAELLLSISRQIAAQHDLPGVLGKLVDSAIEVFGAQHGAVFSRLPSGQFRADTQRNLGPDLARAVEQATTLPLVTQAYETRQMVSVADYASDPRSASIREALVSNGINTVTVAPLISDGELLGTLAIYHDQPHEWRPRDRTLFEQLAAQGAAALRTARMLERTTAWAAQLQSIQQLGVDLNRLDDPRAIGEVIAAELGQLIDYHNVRVYRVEGDDVVPVAWRGFVGIYEGEYGEQLRLRVGEGITGWVAEHGVAVNLHDAATDPRSQTIPGTEDDLDESMLVVPMLHEDAAIGVIVLSKLGLNQFSSDDQRLLEIFAAIAAQAMANADATARLRRQSEALARQVASQRELLRVTQSILGTLDRQELLEQIAERLVSLIPADNVAVDVYDERTGRLTPIFARGSHADLYLAHTSTDQQGIGGYVVRTREPVLVKDQVVDERTLHFAQTGPLPGTLICLPLTARDRVKGLLTIERLGGAAAFSDEEFELAKLFGGHVSIALQNAEAHHAVEMRAQTDALTGLLNHGALIDRLDSATAKGVPFALLMIDLDAFKLYNDRFGHQAGDALLGHLADVLRESCRESDEVYRYGGDEFAIVLPNTSPRGAYAVARKVRAAIAKSATAGHTATTLSCSIGLASHPSDGQAREEILLAADRACYVAKRNGRNRIATAAEGLALAGEFLPPPPTPVDQPAYSAA